jgi:hypothetical protein
VTNISHSLRIKVITVLVAGVAYPCVLRGAIGFFHPKEGVLLQLISPVGGVESLRWVSEHISLPIYELFVFSLWQNAIAFSVVWVVIVILAVGLVSFRARQHAGL